MIDSIRLRGYADIVGKGLGFLVPVFDRDQGNALYVQRIAERGTIAGFDLVENVDARIHFVEPKPTQVGEEAFMAFAFGQDDVVTGQGAGFRESLLARLHDPVLASRPFLSIEVADFLQLGADRIAFIRAAGNRIAQSSERAAIEWLDLSVLTPAVRSELAKSAPRLAAAMPRVVATTSADEIIQRGIDRVALDGPSGIELKRTVHAVMNSLGDLYGKPGRDWRVRLSAAPPRPRTAAPEAVIWFADQEDWDVANQIESDFWWRVDAYRSEEFEAFIEALSVGSETSGFAVFNSRSTRQHHAHDKLTAHKVVVIEFGSTRHLQDGNLEQLHFRSPDATIYVASPGLPGTRRPAKAIAKLCRQIIVALRAVDRQQHGALLEGAWVFMRATGSGSGRFEDALASLYDRAWSWGLDTKQAYGMIASNLASGEDRAIWLLQQLFPSARWVEDDRIDREMREAKTDAALLLPLEDRRTDHENARHLSAITGALAHRGWQVSTHIHSNPGTVSGTEIRIGIDGNFQLLIEGLEPRSGKLDWSLPQLMRTDLSKIRRVTVTGRASPPMVLSHLQHSGVLIANMRDICRSDPEVGIWSIFGAQLARSTGSQLNRARSHFMALILAQAFQRNRCEIDRGDALFDAVHGPTLGEEVQLSWSRVRHERSATWATVRLVAGAANNFARPESDLIAPFVLVLDVDGVSVHSN